MQAVILAAGEGTRLRPKTATKPKPMVRVAGKPILSYCFDTLREIGITDVVVVVGYKQDKITDYYGDSYHELDLTYVTQPERNGLAHAVLMAAPAVESPFLVLNGDNIYRGNLDAVVDHHRGSTAAITFPVDDVSPERATDGAVCQFDGDELVGLVEKPETPPSTTVPMGAYVLPPDIFHACRLIQPSDRGEYELPAAIDLLLTAGYTAETVPFAGWKYNINTESDLDRAAERLAAE